MSRKELKTFKIERAEDLENELKFLTVKKRSFRNLSDNEEENEARKIIKEIMKEKEDFKTELNNRKKLQIKTIENDFDKLISDLNFEKGLIMEETK